MFVNSDALWERGSIKFQGLADLSRNVVCMSRKLSQREVVSKTVLYYIGNNMAKSSEAMDVDDFEAEEILERFGNVSIAGTCERNEDEMLVPPSSPKSSRRCLNFSGKHELTPESKSKNVPASKRYQVGE